MRRLFIIVAWIGISAGTNSAVAAGVDRNFFETRIRPVLVEKCYECHSAQAKAVKGGLLLDTRDQAREGGESGSAIVPGNAEESLLVQALKYDGFEMPPSGKLPPEVIADFETWINAGAPDPRDSVTTKSKAEPNALDANNHWAFQPMTPASPPTVNQPSWVRTPVDAFILARLESAGMQPAPEVEKRTLIRRATFDLIGLPPTPAETEAFLKDDSPVAFANVVERLLASPHYGERWGRYWLDLARYANTNGSDENHEYPNAFRYRDYVVRSFNADKPYNQFVTEQLAGDLLPTPADEEHAADLITATGFLVIGPKMLAEQDKQKMTMDIIDEQVDTVGKTFLGLTTGCARCHDHKFDPIPATDYYALAGIFASTQSMANQAFVSRWQERELPSREIAAKIQAIDQQIEDVEKRLAKETSKTTRWLRQRLRNEFATFLYLEAESPAPANTALELEAKGEALAPTIGALTTDQIARWKEYVSGPASQPGQWMHLWAKFAALPKSNFAPAAADLWRSLQQEAAAGTLPLAFPLKSILDHPAPSSLAELADFYVEMLDRNRSIVQDRSSDSKEISESELTAYKDGLYGANAPLNLPKKEEDRVKLLPTELADPLNAIRAELANVKESRPALPSVMAVLEGKPQDLAVHIRGNHLNLAPTTTPRGFLHLTDRALPWPTINPDQSGRLALAEWIISPRNPLTARVMVNRIWQAHFGQGLVRSPSNFGLRGEAPTHPELLDWLAGQFIEQGWSIKKMHRLIMLSNTYRMSSQGEPRSVLSDPENRLLSRQNRRRLDAEAIRDALFMVGGSLKMETEGVERDPVSPRRSLYQFINRSDVNNMFATFDYVDASSHIDQRPITTVPQQALFMMNNPIVLQQSSALVQQLLKSPTATDQECLATAFGILYGRMPRLNEVDHALRYLSRIEQDFPADMNSETKRAEAWTSLCRVYLAANEFIYID